jgi:uncharacterized protein
MATEPTTRPVLEDAAADRDVETSGSSPLAPVVEGERLSSVDVLRGVAVLGILLMNILDFGVAYRGPEGDLIPSAGPGWADLAYWGISHVLFEGKMRGLFSLLFGAGVVLLTSRLESRSGGEAVADIYYRRTLWLIAFGLFHAYFIWSGDILFDYGLAGLALFPLRKLRPSTLITVGVLILALATLKDYRAPLETRRHRDEAAAADRAEAAGKTLTEEQRDARKQWEEELKGLRPTPEKVAKQVADHRAGYLTLFASRAKEVARSQPKGFYHNAVFDVGGMMLVGMGLMRLGVLSARRKSGVYSAMAAFGYAVGVPLGVYSGYKIWSSGFDPFVYEDMGVWYTPARLAMVLGHVGLIVWLFKAGYLPGLSARLASVGRMALTNYLAASLICTFVFDGFGLGLYDRLSRHQVLVVVAAVWALQLFLSPVWLRHFQYGPAEWLWRTLTYAKRQPFRATVPASS